MKFINFHSTFFSSSYKKRSNKNNAKSPSFSRSTTSSGSITPKSVLPGVSNNEGQISRRELEVVLRRILSSEDEIMAMINEVYERAGGGDGHGNVGMNEILQLCYNGGLKEGESMAFSTPISELRETFSVFDTDGDGRISAEELHGLFLVLHGDGDVCSFDDCRRMIGAVDGDGDGFVCFEDFVRMMNGAQR